MSEKDTAATGDETPKDEPEIIEATIIHESPEPEPKASGPAASETGKASGGFAAKAGWSLVALMTAFGAGVYFSPQFAPGLEKWGLSLPGQQAATLAQERFDSAPLEAALENLQASFSRQQEILAQQQERLQAAATARDALAADLATLAAARMDSPDAQSLDPQRLAALQAEINRLTDDVARLSTLSGEADPQVSQLKGSLALARTEVTTLKARLNAVEEAMEKVQAGALEASPRGRIVLALSRLKDRALIGQPFGDGLSALRPDFAALPALDQQMIGADIAFLAENGAGVAPYDRLVADFDAMAAAAVKETEKEEGGFLANLFTVRRTDAGATGLDAELLKAEKLLAARDVAGAVKVLAGLEGAAFKATQPWREAAEAHVGVARAFDRLITRVSSSNLPLEAPSGMEGSR
ncbi:MAG: hypothetical protein HWE08_06110 [Alphaproteobacteria bacterium]|nr:hypothetical protein [Alphaproteobacteria bacterium]